MTRKRLSAVDADGLRHRMVTGVRTACGTVFIDRALAGETTSTGLDDGDHLITCIGCMTHESAPASNVVCYHCGGFKRVGFAHEEVCPTCDGSGYIHDETVDLTEALLKSIAATQKPGP